MPKQRSFVHMFVDPWDLVDSKRGGDSDQDQGIGPEPERAAVIAQKRGGVKEGLGGRLYSLFFILYSSFFFTS
jgi:hypothetical protein